MNEAMPATRTADIGDIALGYLEWGGAGPPLLLLHATGFHPWLWHPVARELAGKFRVIAPYFCSGRQADPEDGGMSWRLLAEDLAGFCRSLDIEKPFAAGHSMGGAVLTIAGGAPGLSFSGMVLIEPIFLPADYYGISIGVGDHPLASRSIKRRNFWENESDIRDYLESKSFFRRWDREVLDLYAQHGFVPSHPFGFELACSPQQEAALFMGSMAENPWPLMSGITCPVWVCEGEVSENRGFVNLQKAVETFPAGEYVPIEGAGHLIPMEQPSTVLSVIQHFVKDCAGQ